MCLVYVSGCACAQVGVYMSLGLHVVCGSTRACETQQRSPTKSQIDPKIYTNPQTTTLRGNCITLIVFAIRVER